MPEKSLRVWIWPFQFCSTPVLNYDSDAFLYHAIHGARHQFAVITCSSFGSKTLGITSHYSPCLENTKQGQEQSRETSPPRKVQRQQPCTQSQVHRNKTKERGIFIFSCLRVTQGLLSLEPERLHRILCKTPHLSIPTTVPLSRLGSRLPSPGVTHAWERTQRDTMGCSSCPFLQFQPVVGSPGGEGAFPAWISCAAGAVVFVHLEDADKKGIKFECYANKNICVLKSALSSWYI